MTQLADLQFVGYRDIFEDIEKALCSFSSLKKTREELEPCGGMLGKIINLETKVERLNERISNLETETYSMIHGAIKEHEDRTLSVSQPPLPVDKESMIDLIRREAQAMAEIVVRNQLQGLRISFY